MFNANARNLALAVLAAASLAGCENLPGSKGTQGAVVGGAGGAAVGAAVGGEHHRLLGALLGGAIGSAGGYVVGANSDRIMGHDRNSAEEAARRSQEHPASAQDALQATTADINHDGFVTLDEVVAMRDAGISDQQMLSRMQATGQVFELTPEQRQYLLSRGVSQYVVDQMENINRETRDRLLSNQPEVYPAQPYPAQPSTYPAAPAPVASPSVISPPVNQPPINYPPVSAPPVVGQPPPVPPRY